MYNDETPQGPVTFYRAHAKGVLAFAAQPGASASTRSSGGAAPQRSSRANALLRGRSTQAAAWLRGDGDPMPPEQV